MDRDRMNKFQKHNSRTEKVAVESSWGSRLTALRNEGALDAEGKSRNKFQKRAANQPQPVTVAEPAKVLKTRGGVTESSGLTAARLAEENRRAVLKADAAQPKVVHVEMSNADIEAIVTAFKLRHSDPAKPDYFYPSPFNVQNFLNGMERSVAQGKIRWNTDGLERVHEILREKGYYEAVRRVRGTTPAPKVVNPLGDPESQPQVSDQQMDAINAAPELSRAESKKMSLADLAKIVRANYNPNRDGKQIF